MKRKIGGNTVPRVQGAIEQQIARIVPGAEAIDRLQPLRVADPTKDDRCVGDAELAGQNLFDRKEFLEPSRGGFGDLPAKGGVIGEVAIIDLDAPGRGAPIRRGHGHGCQLGDDHIVDPPIALLVGAQDMHLEIRCRNPSGRNRILNRSPESSPDLRGLTDTDLDAPAPGRAAQSGEDLASQPLPDLVYLPRERAGEVQNGQTRPKSTGLKRNRNGMTRQHRLYPLTDKGLKTQGNAVDGKLNAERFDRGSWAPSGRVG